MPQSVLPAHLPRGAGRGPGVSPQTPIRAADWVRTANTPKASSTAGRCGSRWGGEAATAAGHPSLAAACSLAPRRDRCSPGPLPGHLCAGCARRTRIRRIDPLRVSDFWLNPEIAQGSAGGLRPPPQPLPGSLGQRRGSPELGLRLRGAGLLGPSLLPPPRPDAAQLRRSSPGFAAPAGPLPGCGPSAARRGRPPRPPRLPLLRSRCPGEDAPRAPRSRPPGGSAVRWHGPRGCPPGPGPRR